MDKTNSTHSQGRLCEELLELLPAYALGATDPDETRFVQDNLAACAQATAELPGYQELVAAMRDDVPDVAPPADLEDRLMARVAQTSRPVVTPLPAPQRFTPTRLGFIAAVAAIVLLALTNLYWISQVNRLVETNAELAYQLQQDDSDAVLASLATMQWRRLQSQNDPNLLAVLVWKGEDGFLYTLDMPSLPPNNVYQLWLVDPDNHHVSAGTFRVDDRGRGVLHFLAPESIGDFVRLGITSEPIGGSDGPTTSPVAQGEV